MATDEPKNVVFICNVPGGEPVVEKFFVPIEQWNPYYTGIQNMREAFERIEESVESDTEDLAEVRGWLTMYDLFTNQWGLGRTPMTYRNNQATCLEIQEYLVESLRNGEVQIQGVGPDGQPMVESFFMPRAEMPLYGERFNWLNDELATIGNSIERDEVDKERLRTWLINYGRFTERWGTDRAPSAFHVANRAFIRLMARDVNTAHLF